MSVGKPQGIAVLVFGLLLLTGGILVVLNVPSWGSWIAGYPELLVSAPVPPEAARVVGSMSGVLGPLLEHIGGYIQAAGYFIGCLLSLISLVPIGLGATLIKRSGATQHRLGA